jgi:hypothetical protein
MPSIYGINAEESYTLASVVLRTTNTAHNAASLNYKYFRALSPWRAFFKVLS